MYGTASSGLTLVIGVVDVRKLLLDATFFKKVDNLQMNKLYDKNAFKLNSEANEAKTTFSPKEFIWVAELEKSCKIRRAAD